MVLVIDIMNRIICIFLMSIFFHASWNYTLGHHATAVSFIFPSEPSTLSLLYFSHLFWIFPLKVSFFMQLTEQLKEKDNAVNQQLLQQETCQALKHELAELQRRVEHAEEIRRLTERKLEKVDSKL